MTGTAQAPPVVLAAGAVLWRERRGRLEVVLVHRPRYDDWSLPKGKLDPGEHLLETAVREVAEETGFAVRLGRSLGAAAYVALGAPKRVHYWSGEVLGGAFTAGAEVDDLAWQPVETAQDLLARDSDRAVLSELLRLPLHTDPVIVLRHAKALPRKTWPADDEKRPLAPEGVAQAKRLVGLLRAYAPRTAASSPAVRCVQTVEPYLADGGVTLRTEQKLSERGHAQAPEAAAAALAALIRTGESSLVCTHRPVLLSMVQRAGQLAGTAPDPAPLRPAEMLVCHTAGGRIVGVERHRP